MMNQNFKIKEGNSLNVLVTVRKEDNSLLDLNTVESIEFKFGNVLKSLATGGIEKVDALGGKFRIKLSPADTQGLQGNYVYEVRVSGSGNVHTVMSGVLEIENTVF